MDFKHIPVLLEKVIEGFGLNEKVSEVSEVSPIRQAQGKQVPEAIYIDGTIGGGGHTQKILELGGRVLGIDQDEDAILHLKKKFESEITQGLLVLEHGNYAEITNYTERRGISSVDGILLDLGVSSYQMDTSGRGFSFKEEGELDMRMDRRSDTTAAQIVNTYSFEQLYEIFAKYGEEPKASIYAKKIIDGRRNTKIKTTKELVDILIGDRELANYGGIHPATRVFQALRIVVNDELGNLKKGLDSGFKLLKGGGRMEVISFHSLEDRIVKLFFLKLEREGLGKILTKKPIIAAEEEIRRNRRSRSAKMRIIERVKG